MTSSFKSILLTAYTTGISPTTLKTLCTQASSSLSVEYRVRSQTATTPFAPWKNASLRRSRKPFSPMMSQTVMSMSIFVRSRVSNVISRFETFAPSVVMYRSSNSSWTNRRIREVLPTAASPIRQTFVLMRWASGIGGVRRIPSKTDYVLCDFKIADIPNTNRLIVEQAVDAGASGIICHGFVGEDSVRACVDAARGADVFVLVEMSHPGGLEYSAKYAEDLARVAARVNAAGIIAPATRPERVRALRAIIGRKQILAPGVGAQGGKASEAIAAGADAVIVGRALYEAVNPAEAAKAIVGEIRSIVSR